ncbi:xanthine dehydrogenase [Thalassospira lucentensis]|uniref:Xanthine dehydrogenase n=1 Tax=Thalassospira lucentensis TaxID=168935 RepID=A0A154L8F4_9PROT|nr:MULTISPECIES: xanthine dehydrogenase accessory protein XdhC [Thalassospira]KZB65722.1 xanthine dehydrogenase [Thalassospira lucentensis]MCH2273766.1 xanthine dehydrogenase accessory protein XdhC [Thalassospira sp.]
MRLSHDAHIAVLQSPDPVMIISVAAIRGSTPREAGAFMLVSENSIAGTIGGGNLEHQVTLRARQALASQGDIIAELVAFPLGPGLGQCCGGAVDIAFHRLDPMQKHQLATAIRTTQNSTGLDHGAWVMLPMGESRNIETASTQDADALDRLFAGGRGGLCDLAGQQKLCLRLDDGATPLWLFGAGHVGQAIVQALAPLPFDIHLIDSRDEYLTLPETSKLHLHQSERPEDEVADMPPDAFALILTHSHAQDFDICRAALMRNDLGFVGMIGSQTKRARFVRRLKGRGLGDTEIGRLTCPIGIQGITGKQPSVIAASVAVQLLSVREARLAQYPVNRVAQDGLAG